MADRKISDLTALTAPAAGDYLPIVDISEASAANKNKRITIEELLRGAPDGTAAAPSIGFESDPNTGIYRPGADQLAISTGGTGRLFVDSSGNVGLGTSSPVGKLNVAGYSSADVAQDIQITRSSSGTGIQTGPNLTLSTGTSTDTIALQGTQGRFGIWNYASSSWVERFCVTGPGNVGVGTTSPAGKCVVRVSDATGDETAWNSNYLLVSGGDAATSHALGLGVNTSGGYSFITSLAPSSAWKTMKYKAIDHVFDGVSGNERARIDSSGRLLSGVSTARANFINSTVDAQVQIERSGEGTGELSLVRNVASTSGPLLIFGKSRGASVGSNTIVNSGDQLGWISFEGSDGTEFVQSASITAEVDGTPGANDMPGRLVFSTTADGASDVTERMRITQNGTVAWGANIASLYNFLGSDGSIASRSTYDNYTTASAANVHLSSNYYFYRSTSSIKYKTNVETLADDYADAILECRPVWYQSTCEADNPEWGYWGFIAEEVASIDPRLCFFRDNEDGSLEPEGVQYDRFVPHLVNIIKRQQQAIETLEAKVAALEAA